MKSSSISSPQTFSKTAGSKKYEFVSKVYEKLDGKKDAKVGTPGVDGLSTEQSERLGSKRDSGDPKTLAIERPTFLRDPRLSMPDLSRLFHPVCQNVKENEEPNLSRAEGEEDDLVALLGVRRSEHCQDYYFLEGGCKTAKCPFAHGDCEIGEPFYMPPKDAIVFRPITGKTEGRRGKCDSPPPFTALVFPYIDASHVGILFGQRGEIFQWLCNLTGVKVTVENNKQLPGFKKVVISGEMASCTDSKMMVRALLDNFVYWSKHDKIPPVLDYKAELCKDFSKGCCKDAETCCFAHGKSELRPRTTELLERAKEARRELKNIYDAATRTFL